MFLDNGKNLVDAARNIPVP